MKEWLMWASEHAITLIDAVALVVIVLGSLEAVLRAAPLAFAKHPGPALREVWLRYSRWLVAGLTFQLAADLIETSITTNWEAIARVGAIAIIRTFLDYFLGRDASEIRERQREPSRIGGQDTPPKHTTSSERE